jgi:hypothetical protein
VIHPTNRCNPAAPLAIGNDRIGYIEPCTHRSSMPSGHFPLLLKVYHRKIRLFSNQAIAAAKDNQLSRGVQSPLSQGIILKNHLKRPFMRQNCSAFQRASAAILLLAIKKTCFYVANCLFKTCYIYLSGCN